MEEKRIFPLSKLTQAIENVINTHCNQPVWVKAEIVKLNYYQQAGHCYPDLVEKKGGKIIAELKGTIWKKQYDRINTKFREVLHEDLKDDMTVVIQARVTYHSVYGLSLNILDIDPEYTLGELAKQRAETIKRLKEEGLFAANKKTQLPQLPKTIAIISVETSKGYQDFLNVIAQNPWGYTYHCKLFPAILQGQRAVSTISAQMDSIMELEGIFDAVAIIRGGGGEIGLSCYDDYSLASKIVGFPIPVLTGIGHSTNETVSELVSYQSFITPTKIAEFLLQQFHDLAFPLKDMMEKIKNQASRGLERQHSGLRETSKLFHSYINRIFERNQHHLVQLKGSILNHSESLFQQERAELKNISTSLRFLSPETILRRGYSISRLHGKVVQNLEEAREGDQLETQLYNGKINSRITGVELKPEK